MSQFMRRITRGGVPFYTCSRLQTVRHAFTTKAGGVSHGDCESLNLGFNRGDTRENVLQNYHILADALSVPYDRLTATCQVHRDEVSVVTKEHVGMGLARPMAWESDAIVTALPDTPLVGYYADCVVTLLYDPATHTCGVCHSGWRGTAMAILRRTAGVMAQSLGTRLESLVAVMGPSIHPCCFETDADVPAEMERRLGARIQPFISARGAKFHVDLQSINAMLLEEAGLLPENIIDSGICTMCRSGEFWSHRATQGRRGVQAAVICL